MDGFKNYYACRVDHTCNKLDVRIKNKAEAKILPGIWLEILPRCGWYLLT